MHEDEDNALIDECRHAAHATLATASAFRHIDVDWLAQELWLRFSHLAPARQSPGALRLAAQRMIIDLLRREKRQKSLPPAVVDARAEDPADSVARREAADVLLKKLAITLSSAEHAVLMYFYEAETRIGSRGAYRRIAKLLGYKENTVAQVILRIRRKAERFLDEYEELFGR